MADEYQKCEKCNHGYPSRWLVCNICGHGWDEPVKPSPQLLVIDLDKIRNKIRNAKPGTMCDLRTRDNQIDSVPVEKLSQFTDAYEDLQIVAKEILHTLVERSNGYERPARFDYWIKAINAPIGELVETPPTSRGWLTREPLPLNCQCSPDGLCDKHCTESAAAGG